MRVNGTQAICVISNIFLFGTIFFSKEENSRKRGKKILFSMYIYMLQFSTFASVPFAYLKK